MLARADAKQIPLLILCNKISSKDGDRELQSARENLERAFAAAPVDSLTEADEDFSGAGYKRQQISDSRIVSFLAGAASEKNAKGEIVLAEETVDAVCEWTAAVSC